MYNCFFYFRCRRRHRCWECIQTKPSSQGGSPVECVPVSKLKTHTLLHYLLSGAERNDTASTHFCIDKMDVFCCCKVRERERENWNSCNGPHNGWLRHKARNLHKLLHLFDFHWTMNRFHFLFCWFGWKFLIIRVSRRYFDPIYLSHSHSYAYVTSLSSHSLFLSLCVSASHPVCVLIVYSPSPTVRPFAVLQAFYFIPWRMEHHFYIISSAISQ